MSDWNQVIYPAAVLLADLTNNVTFHYAVQSYLRPWLCGVGGDIHYTSGGLAYNDNDNSLAQTMNSAFLATVYAQSISSQAQRHAGNFSADAAESYLCYAERQVHYMLGPNHTYLVGAEGGPTHVYERASSCPADLSVACTASSALYVDTSNPNLPVGGLVYGMGSKSDQLSDIRTPDTTTHVSHAYTVGLTGALAGLNALTSGNSGFSECPAGVGILDSALALCS